MNFAFSEEQEAFRETLRRFLADRSPSEQVRRLTERVDGHDPHVWKQMAEELTLQALHIPEDYGGQGFGFLELAIVLEEMGRRLFCSPYFSTICLAANAILNAGSEAQKRALLPGIASGETVATVATPHASRAGDPPEIHLEYRVQDEAVAVTGRAGQVIDGALADIVVVPARRAGTSDRAGVALLAVRSDAPGLSITPVDALDPTRKLADLEFHNVSGELLGEPDCGALALERTLDQAAALLAAECAGGAQACLDAAVEYAKARVQFGRPIGSFQAVKHKCAELLLEVESAKSAAYWAAWTAAEHPSQLAEAASLAKAFCADAYLRAAAENIQIHGGVGFTWESDCHLYYRRARSSEILLGDSVWHRDRLARALRF